MNARLGFQGLAARAYIKERLVTRVKEKVYGLTCHLAALKLVQHRPLGEPALCFLSPLYRWVLH